jgi:transposase
MNEEKPTYSPEFRLEAAQSVVNQGRPISEAAEAMRVCKSTMDKWVRQLRQEHNGISPQTTPMKADHRKNRKLLKRRRRVEEEKEIFRIPIGHYEATARLMSDFLNNFR